MDKFKGLWYKIFKKPRKWFKYYNPAMAFILDDMQRMLEEELNRALLYGEGGEARAGENLQGISGYVPLTQKDLEDDGNS